MELRPEDIEWLSENRLPIMFIVAIGLFISIVLVSLSADNGNIVDISSHTNYTASYTNSTATANNAPTATTFVL